MAGWISNLGLSLLLAQAPAEAPPVRDSSDVFTEADRLWKEGELEQVSRLFEDAYDADPDPEYLFGRAHAEAQLGHCKEAAALLEAFLATNPPAEQVAAQDEMGKCVPSEPEPEPEPPPPVPIRPEPVEDESDEPSAVPPVTPSNDAPTRRRADVLGVTLTGFGVAFAGAGVPLALLGRSRAVDPPRGSNEDDYRRSIESGRTMVGLGIGLSTVGVGLLVAGIVRLAKRR